MSGGFDQLQDQIAGIVNKIDRIPRDSIGSNLNASLGDLDKTLKQVNVELLPQGTQTLQQAQRTIGAAQNVMAENGPLQQDIGQTLEEVRKAARSVRTLTDLLGRHPEALVRGLHDGAKAPAEPSNPATAPEPKK